MAVSKPVMIGCEHENCKPLALSLGAVEHLRQTCNKIRSMSDGFNLAGVALFRR